MNIKSLTLTAVSLLATANYASAKEYTGPSQIICSSGKHSLMIVLKKTNNAGQSNVVPGAWFTDVTKNGVELNEGVVMPELQADDAKDDQDVVLSGLVNYDRILVKISLSQKTAKLDNVTYTDLDCK